MDTPQGWYQDPSEPTLLRWWDGTKWTSHTAPNQQYAPQPMTQTALPYGYSQTMSHESSPSSNGFVKAGSIIQIVSSALGFMLGVIMLLLGNEAEEMFPGVGLDAAIKVLGIVTATISVLVLVLGIMAFRGRKWAIVTSLVLYGLVFIQDAVPAVSSGNPADLIGAFPVLTVVTFVLLFVGLRKLD